MGTQFFGKFGKIRCCPHPSGWSVPPTRNPGYIRWTRVILTWCEEGNLIMGIYYLQTNTEEHTLFYQDLVTSLTGGSIGLHLGNIGSSTGNQVIRNCISVSLSRTIEILRHIVSVKNALNKQWAYLCMVSSTWVENMGIIDDFAVRGSLFHTSNTSLVLEPSCQSSESLISNHPITFQRVLISNTLPQ